MALAIEPTRTEEGWAWTLGGVRLSATRIRRGWQYSRTGLDTPATLEGEDDEPPFAVDLRLGTDPHVAYLDPPVLLLRGESRLLWLAWPLEIAALRGETASDVFRPGLRHTLIGAVDRGQVLEAVVCPVVDGPEAEEIGQATGRAALRVRAANHAEAAVTLRRFPVAPSELSLYRDHDRLVASEVSIEIREGNRAQAHSTEGRPPEGYEIVASPEPETRHHGGLSLGWLLEATKRSTEFSL